MVSSEVENLAALTTPATVDLFHIIDDPAGTPTSKKITYADLFSPWLQDILAGSFDLRNISNLEFVDPSTGAPAGTIHNLHVVAGGLVINTPTGDNVDIQVNGVTHYTFDVDKLDLNSNTLLWVTGLQIFNDAGGMNLDVPDGDNFDFRIDTSSETTLGAVDGLRLQIRLAQNKGADIASADEVIFDNNGNAFDITGTTTINHFVNTNWLIGSVVYIHWDAATPVNHNTGGLTGNQTNISLIGDANNTFTVGEVSTFLLHDATTWEEIGRSDPAGSGSQTPWTSDIDAATNSLSNLDLLDFDDNVDAPVASQAQIYWDSPTGLNYNVPTGDTHEFKVNNITQTRIDANGITTINRDITIGSGTYTMGAGQSFGASATLFTFDMPISDTYRFRINSSNVLTMSATVVGINGLALELDTSKTIAPVGGGIEYRTLTATDHDFLVNSLSQLVISETQIDFQANTLIDGIVNSTITGVSGITGLGAQAQALDMLANAISFSTDGHTITPASNNVTYDVSAANDSHIFTTAATQRLVINNIDGVHVLNARFNQAKGTDEVAATELTLASNGNVFDITGATTINTISATDWKSGVVIHLQFDGGSAYHT